jgi:hypothetical protein
MTHIVKGHKCIEKIVEIVTQNCRITSFVNNKNLVVKMLVKTNVTNCKSLLIRSIKSKVIFEAIFYFYPIGVETLFIGSL